MLGQLWEILEAISAAIIMIGGAGTIIVSIYKWAKSPDATRDEKLKKHDELLANDNKRLKELEEWRKESDSAQKVMMKSMLALMTHAIDGNHVEELKMARDDLQSYLISK